MLILEDSLDDAEIIQHYLKKENLNFEFQVAKDRGFFMSALDNYFPDVILADNSLPQFSAKEALEIIMMRPAHIPFIVVTGSISEEFAAQIIKLGADDYILKDRLARLPAAIMAAIKQQKTQELAEKVKEDLNKEKMERQKELGKHGKLFFTDSLTIINQLAQIKSTTQDSENLLVIGKLDTIIKNELNWLLNNNLPDSIIKNKSPEHIASFITIDSLINKGISRTIFLINYRKTQLKKELERVRVWMILFIALSGSLLIFTTINLFKQQLRRKIKEKEIEDYKHALDESAIVAITDQKGIIKYVNDNFCKISKYSREDLIGQDHRVINSGFHSKDFIRNIWTTIANGKIWKGELKNRAKDGTIYWVDTTIVPFLNEKRKPYQYIAIRADITERKKVEENLIKSEKIYRTIASSIPGSVICLLDHEYRYLLIEGDMIGKLGYSKDLLLGNMAADVLPPEIFKSIEKEFEAAFNGEIVTIESSRSDYDIISKFIPLKDDHDKVYSIMTVAIDVTQLKKAQRSITELNRGLEEKIMQRTEQLNKSNEELEAFSYSVSHDLRAPLRAIIGFATILQEDYGNKLDEEGLRIISVIKNNTLKMGNLIDDLLAFSRLGKQGLVVARINTLSMVNEIINDLSLTEKKRGINWRIQSLPEINADLSTIRQVWINLISNAIKYSRNQDKPCIEIGHHFKENQSVFYVKDNGVGFDDSYRHKLFKVFQRLHSASDFEGTGVGLALVQKIIARHSGKVWAEGKVNEGATFYFSLPLSNQ